MKPLVESGQFQGMWSEDWQIQHLARALDVALKLLAGFLVLGWEVVPLEEDRKDWEVAGYWKFADIECGQEEF